MSVKNRRAYPLLFAQALVFSLLAVFACLFMFCAVQRVAYPFELEWLEGEMICHGLQLLQGLQVYGPPSSQFIAEIYPPVYYYVIAAVFKLAGSVSFPLLRLVSVMSLAGILVLLYRIIRREEGSRATALLACGFFISFYEIHGPWYDVGRVDMLFFFFIVSGLYALAYARNRLCGDCRRRRAAGACLLYQAVGGVLSAVCVFVSSAEGLASRAAVRRACGGTGAGHVFRPQRAHPTDGLQPMFCITRCAIPS